LKGRRGRRIALADYPFQIWNDDSRACLEERLGGAGCFVIKILDFSSDFYFKIYLNNIFLFYF
jgi:hypothetical protein